MLVSIMAFSMIACGNSEGKSGGNQSTGGSTMETKDSMKIAQESLVTYEVFSQPANYQGMQGGWYGKAIKDSLNIELNIISPNVSGGGDSLYQTRSIAGNLGDIVILDYAKMKDCVESGLVIELSQYLEGKEYINQYKTGIDNLAEYIGVDGIYAIPANMSLESAFKVKLNNGQVNEAVFMPWDYYKELGMPDIKDTDVLLDVMEQMQKNHPTSDLSGGKTYGFSIFKDWDSTSMAMASRITMAYGYAPTTNFVFSSADCSRTSIITEDNGAYYNALKLLFNANQRGLVDPDSSAQDFSTMSQKVQNKEVLYVWFPWMITGFNNEHKSKGTGYAYIPVDTQKIVTDGYNPYGSDGLCFGIGVQADDPKRIMDYFEWSCTPEGLDYYAWNIPGLTYELVNGKPVYTEYGSTATVETTVPDEYGGGTLNSGQCQIGASIGGKFDINPITGEAYEAQLWSSTIENGRTMQDDEWSDRFGADDPLTYLQNKNMLEVIPGNSYMAEKESTDLENKRTQCGTAIVQASWQMVFADNETEFQNIWNNMKTELEGLGFTDVVNADIVILEKIKEARTAASEIKE